MFVLAGMAALVKWCSARGVGVLEMMFFRNAFAFIPVGLYIWRTCGFGELRTQRIAGHAARAVVGLSGMFCGFSALHRLPLTEATAFSFAAPLFVTALSAPLLREPVDRHGWAAVAVGFLGVLIMIQPQPGHMNPAGASFALVGAVCAAFAMITVREMGRTESGATITFYYSIAGCLVGLAGAPFGWTIPDTATLAGLAVMGLLGGTGQLLLTESLRVAPVGVVAPFDYTQLLWASVLGLVIWGELPRVSTLTGAVVVAASGLYIVLHETRRFRGG